MTTPQRPSVTTTTHQRRDRRLTIRFDEDEHEAVVAAAAQAQLAVSAWAGRVLAAEVEQASRPLAWADELRKMEAVQMEARRAGTLLNEAVERLHARGEAPPELAGALDEAREAVVSLAKATDKLARVEVDGG